MRLYLCFATFLLLLTGCATPDTVATPAAQQANAPALPSPAGAATVVAPTAVPYPAANTTAMAGARIGALSAACVDQIVAGLRFQQASFFRR